MTKEKFDPNETQESYERNIKHFNPFGYTQDEMDDIELAVNSEEDAILGEGEK